MKRSLLTLVTLLVAAFVLGLGGFATYTFWLFPWTPFDEPSFFSLLTLYGSLILVLVTGAYVISTKRYVDLFQKDTETRQAVQEEWELRRFYASRIFGIADGLAELFYASKRELEVYLVQAQTLEAGAAEIHKTAIANAAGTGTLSPAVAGRIDALWDATYIKYNDRAKDYNWRAQVLIHQARFLVYESLCERILAVFNKVSRGFQNNNEGREVFQTYEDSLPEVTSIIQELHTIAVDVTAKRRAVK